MLPLRNVGNSQIFKIVLINYIGERTQRLNRGRTNAIVYTLAIEPSAVLYSDKLFKISDLVLYISCTYLDCYPR